MCPDFTASDRPPDEVRRPATDPSCEVCGAPGALELGGRRLCPDCCHLSGACCPEFGAWDAWREVLRAPAGEP
jgi:hypothetical protein